MIYFFAALILIISGIGIYSLTKSAKIPGKIEEAEKCIQQEKFSEAIEKLKAILKLETGHPKARYLLAKAYYETDQNILAINELKKILVGSDWKKHINETDIRLLLAEVYHNSREYAKEINEYKTIQNLNPNDPVVNEKLAHIYFDQHDYERAYESFSKASKYVSDDKTFIFPYAISAYETKHFYEARTLFEKALRYSPHNNEIYYYLGSILKQDGQKTKALDYYIKAISDNAVGDKAAVQAALIYMDGRKWKKALDILKNIQPGQTREHKDAAYYLAQCYEKLGQIKQALELWERLNVEHNNYRNVLDKIEQYRNIGRSDHLLWLFSLDGEESLKAFEKIIKRMGYIVSKGESVSEQKYRYICFRDKNRFDEITYMEIHKTMGEISEVTVHDFIKYRESIKSNHGILFSTGGATKGALKMIENNKIELIYGDEFLNTLQKYRS